MRDRWHYHNNSYMIWVETTASCLEGMGGRFRLWLRMFQAFMRGWSAGCCRGQVYEGDMALCTVPLGVLKNGSMKFAPELPQRKLDGIKRLGLGLLNKVAMLFPYVFWSTDLDTFGHLSDHPSRRGEFFLFYSYATVAGGPLLIALVAGEAAHNFERMPPADVVTVVLHILRGNSLFPFLLSSL